MCVGWGRGPCSGMLAWFSSIVCATATQSVNSAFIRIINQSRNPPLPPSQTPMNLLNYNGANNFKQFLYRTQVQTAHGSLKLTSFLFVLLRW